jgi:DNA polymerase-3 subunit epsilon
VIELCVQHGLEQDASSQTWRIRPSVPIHPGAQAVHGISMEDLAGCPPFEAFADDIRAVFRDARVLVGYNMLFDIGMLQAEYHRLRQPPLDLRGKHMVDAFRLWQQCEPRSLQHAHLRFVGDSFEAAHSATADVAATGRVLQGMVEAFGLSGRDWDSIADVCEPERASWVGPSRHIRWTRNGAIVVGFGRHAGTPVHMLANSPDRDYLLWILDKDFPPHVHAICRHAMDLQQPVFRDWIQRSFGLPHFLQMDAGKRPGKPGSPGPNGERSDTSPSDPGARV